MLKGISPAVSPDLLKTLAEMGHGDEIVISDAHFPAHTFNPRVLRADGTPAPHLAREQLARLRAEGVLAEGHRVDLRRYRWRAP